MQLPKKMFDSRQINIIYSIREIRYSSTPVPTVDVVFFTIFVWGRGTYIRFVASNIESKNLKKIVFTE